MIAKHSVGAHKGFKQFYHVCFNYFRQWRQLDPLFNGLLQQIRVSWKLRPVNESRGSVEVICYYRAMINVQLE